ncbi:hypothetical protein [Nocardia puris]|uniref:Uncharacterized protein n=1 Tax=Nocardia puris TaxID=208602 RepID=A0A366DAI3_9NOCA|nr:hypothetical protein [Nocardia puris]RBO87057.1 hypothetical protein DFR74_112237 [Nocardia puris]
MAPESAAAPEPFGRWALPDRERDRPELRHGATEATRWVLTEHIQHGFFGVCSTCGHPNTWTSETGITCPNRMEHHA